MEKIVTDLFTRFGETVAGTLSALLRKKVSISPPVIHKLDLAGITTHISAEGGVCAVYFSLPFPSGMIFFLPSELARLLPESVINPEMKETPSVFTDLHRSALTEMMNNVWGAVANSFSDSLNLPVKISASDVSWSTLANSINNITELKEAQAYYCAFFKLVSSGSRGTLTAAVIPSSFVERIVEKAVKPSSPSPVKEKVAMEKFKVAHLPAVAAPDKSAVAQEKKFRYPRNIEALLDIPMEIVVELGERRMEVAKILNIAPGAIVELGREVSNPVNVKIGGVLIGRGEVVSVGDNFGVRITQLVTPAERLEGK